MKYAFVSRSVSQRMALLVAVLLVLVSLAQSLSVRPAEAATQRARVAVTLWAVPSIHVARGTILAYKLRIENHGNATMAYARLSFPYDQSKLTLVDTLFESGNDFVELIEPERVQVYIGEVGKDSSRFAVLYFYVADYLPNNTVIDMWVDYVWEDRNGNYDLDSRSNAAPVLVNEANITSDYVWMTVDQTQASRGTTFHFFSDRFIPGEKIEAWLRYPDGREEDLGDRHAADADPTGRIHVHFDSDRLSPDRYTMILRGDRSHLEGVHDFTVLD